MLEEKALDHITRVQEHYTEELSKPAKHCSHFEYYANVGKAHLKYLGKHEYAHASSEYRKHQPVHR